MTGCTNACARPRLAEIGLVGRGPGNYYVCLGAASDGSRLNELNRQDVGHGEIVAALTRLIERYAEGRYAGARFGVRDPQGLRRADRSGPCPFTPVAVITTGRILDRRLRPFLRETDANRLTYVNGRAPHGLDKWLVFGGLPEAALSAVGLTGWLRWRAEMGPRTCRTRSESQL